MLQFTKNALSILEDRYLRKDAKGVILETPDELFHRVAEEIAKAEIEFNPKAKKKAIEWNNNFYKLLCNGDFIPNSPTLMNAGLGSGQLSACFVLPLKNNLKSIFNTLTDTALIQQSGGGTGFNFSNLTPEGEYNTETGLREIGSIPILKIFNSATEQIKQGGKRRGANMGILNVWHPDILQFVRLKRHTALENFNLSVGITDDFMDAVEQKGMWELIHPVTKKVISVLKAQVLWAEIIQSARETGDPGLVFLDEINRQNPLIKLGRLEATNPCGEVPLFPYEACTLGSINLSNMIEKLVQTNEIDWAKLEQTIERGIRFLDNTIEVNKYLLPAVEKQVKSNRKIGLGVMGWADMLIQLRIPYDSDEAVNLAEQVMGFIDHVSLRASAELAKERGTFPNWKKSSYYPDTPLRNATRTAIAPTGTISTLANTSFSIEPLFALSYERKLILGGQTHQEINPLIQKYLMAQNDISPNRFDSAHAYTDDTLLNLLGEDMKSFFPTALNIAYEYHIKHQIAFQKYTDNAVSKTINLPEEASTADIEGAFMMAWKQGAKGITIYRYNSKKEQVLNIQDQSHFCECDRESL